MVNTPTDGDLTAVGSKSHRTGDCHYEPMRMRFIRGTLRVI